MAKDYVSMLGSPQGGLVGNLMRGVAQGHKTQVARHKARVDRANLALEGARIRAAKATADMNHLAKMRQLAARTKQAQDRLQFDRDKTEAELKLAYMKEKRQSEQAELALGFRAAEFEKDAEFTQARIADMGVDNKREERKLQAQIKGEGSFAKTTTPKWHETGVGADVFNGIKRNWGAYGFEGMLEKKRTGRYTESSKLKRRVLDALSQKTSEVVANAQKEHWFNQRNGLIPDTQAFDPIGIGSQTVEDLQQLLVSTGALVQNKETGEWENNPELVLKVLEDLDLNE